MDTRKVDGIGIGWIWTGYLAKEGGPASATITGKQDMTQVLFKGNVTATVLNVRTWAGTEYPNIKKYPKLNQGNEVEVMNFTQKDKNGSKWYYIRIAGKYYGFVSAKYVKKQKEKSGMCPKCAGALVLRKGKYGKFYGCSNYPKCRYTAPVK